MGVLYQFVLWLLHAQPWGLVAFISLPAVWVVYVIGSERIKEAVAFLTPKRSQRHIIDRQTKLIATLAQRNEDLTEISEDYRARAEAGIILTNDLQWEVLCLKRELAEERTPRLPPTPVPTNDSSPPAVLVSAKKSPHA